MILITKADGNTEPFDSSKLERSLKRAGASQEVVGMIVKKVSAEITPLMTTKKIYQKAFALLRSKEKAPIAARYSIKKAVFDLGPSGFPFEDFVAEIYRAMGYTASTGVILKGKCAEHEVDLVAQKDGDVHGAEIKFHNNAGVKTDLKVALYVQARFLDLKEGGEVQGGSLITNTRFTNNATQYGECAGLTLISWEYPEKGNLYTLIEETGLHPITCLTTLPKQNKKRLIDNKIVLCRSIKENTSILESYGVPEAKIPDILSEISALCQPGSGV